MPLPPDNNIHLLVTWSKLGLLPPKIFFFAIRVLESPNYFTKAFKHKVWYDMISDEIDNLLS